MTIIFLGRFFGILLSCVAIYGPCNFSSNPLQIIAFFASILARSGTQFFSRKTERFLKQCVHCRTLLRGKNFVPVFGATTKEPIAGGSVPKLSDTGFIRQQNQQHVQLQKGLISKISIQISEKITGLYFPEHWPSLQIPTV